MKKFYKIEDNYAELLLSKDIYPLVSVKKALSNYMEEAYIKIDSNDDKLRIQIIWKENIESKEDIERKIDEFYNECLRESLRYSIAIETKNLRELIVGRALYTTCIEVEKNDEDTKENVKEEYDLDEIAVNWFEKYKNEEEQKC